MLSKTVQATMVLAAILGTWPRSALPGSSQPLAGRCEIAISRIQPVSQRTRVEAEFAQLSGTCLKELYLRCSRESSQNLLGFREAVLCSFGHETLLKREFGGDFNALLAWWRVHRDDPVGR